MSLRIRLDPRDAITAVGVAVIAAAVFFVAASLDPEPYHDGSQLPAAIAVSEGLVVHLDVFSGYGFITAWIQGLAVTLFGPSLLVIRLLSAAILTISAVLTFALARWAIGNRRISAGIALTWVVTWPGQAVIWGTPLFPWPSTFFLMFQLIAVLLTARALLHREHRPAMFALAGIVLGIAVLTRLNYGAALALALLATMLVMARSRSLKLRDFAVAIGSTLITGALLLSIIALQGGFQAFVDQSILGPLEGKAIVKPTEWFYIENGYLWGSLLLLVTTLAMVWVSRQPWISPRNLLILSGLAVAGLTVWASTAIEGSPLRNLILSRLTWAPALDIQAMQPLYFSAVLTILILIGVIAALVIFRIRGGSLTGTPNQVFIMLLAATGAASLVQLFPVADPNHLWWAAPIPLVLIVFVFTLNRPVRATYAVSAILLLPPLIISIPTAYVFLSQPRTQLDQGALAGMWVKQEYLNDYRSVDRLLLKIPPRSARIDCHEGLLAVWNGTYLSASAGYIDYAYGLENTSPPRPVVWDMTCINTADRAEAGEYPKPVSPDAMAEDIRLSYFSDMSLYLTFQRESP